MAPGTATTASDIAAAPPMGQAGTATTGYGTTAEIPVQQVSAGTPIVAAPFREPRNA